MGSDQDFSLRYAVIALFVQKLIRAVTTKASWNSKHLLCNLVRNYKVVGNIIIPRHSPLSWFLAAPGPELERAG